MRDRTFLYLIETFMWVVSASAVLAGGAMVANTPTTTRIETIIVWILAALFCLGSLYGVVVTMRVRGRRQRFMQRERLGQFMPSRKGKRKSSTFEDDDDAQDEREDRR